MWVQVGYCFLEDLMIIPPCVIHAVLSPYLERLPDSIPPLPFHPTILCSVCPGLPLPQFCLLAWFLPRGSPFQLPCTLPYTDAQAGAPWDGSPCSSLWAFPNTCVFPCAHMCCFLSEKQMVIYIMLNKLNLFYCHPSGTY